MKEHTVAKLGHCRTCEAYDEARKAEIKVPREEDVVAAYFVKQDPIVLEVCGGPCRVNKDGKHDFDWATYSDDRESYGVCACGISALDYDMLVMP